MEWQLLVGKVQPQCTRSRLALERIRNSGDVFFDLGERGRVCVLWNSGECNLMLKRSSNVRLPDTFSMRMFLAVAFNTNSTYTQHLCAATTTICSQVGLNRRPRIESTQKLNRNEWRSESECPVRNCSDWNACPWRSPWKLDNTFRMLST